MKANVHGWAGDDDHDTCMEYAALVESMLGDEDDVETEFSMLKCQMIEDGTYYE